MLFKKIDSTLRGNPGVEIVAALQAFGCEAMVVNPAFPAQKRVVKGGILRVTGDPSFQPIEIGAWLRTHGATDRGHVRPPEIAVAIAGGARFVFLDAVRDGDLSSIAAESLQIGKRVLWAGSGGLAAALARSICSHARPPAHPPKQTGQVLFCVGSDHRVTLEQQTRFLQQRNVQLLHAATSAIGAVGAEIEYGNHVLLRIPRGEIPAESLRSLLSDAHPAALLLSGGDTASLVCRALGAKAVEMCCELVPGIPIGVLRGGVAENCTIVTKSGGFGSPDDLIRIGDYFHG